MFYSARSLTTSAFFHFVFGLLVFFALFEQMTARPLLQTFEIRETGPRKVLISKNKTEPSQQVLPGKVQETDHSQTAASVGDDSALKDLYIHELMTFLNQHKNYPRLAKLKRQEGVVTVEFSITLQGKISDIRLVQQSNFQELNQATLDLVQDIGKVPVPPLAMQVQLPIIYSLN